MRAGDYRQAMIPAGENVRNLFACVVDRRRSVVRLGQLLLKNNRRDDDFRSLDAKVV